jgi:putative transcriptional regulator
MSRAVVARCLNVTVGYVSQRERGARRPTGPALVLLGGVRRGGIEAIR